MGVIMTNLTFKGNAVHIQGALPLLNSLAPPFTLTKNDLSEFSLANFKGKRIVLNIFPSLDTPVCSASVRRFNEIAQHFENVIIICISADLPFAHLRFCTYESLTRVVYGSVFRHPEFGRDYGLTLIDGPMAGLLSRCILIIDETGKIKYTQQVAEISREPDYEPVVKALQTDD
jgi:thiol peroxidase